MDESRKRPGQNIQLSSLDDLLGTSGAESQEIVKIPLTSLLDNTNQYRKVEHNDYFFELTQSILDDGQITPIIVRPHPNRNRMYEIIAGHHRTEAHRYLDKDTIDAIVMDIDDNTSDIILFRSNLQKTDALPSERSKGYKLYMDAIKKRNKSKDNSKEFSPKKTARAELAEIQKISEPSIQRYLRLNFLIPPLLEFVDNKKIKIAVAESLSFLCEDSQRLVSDFLDLHCDHSLSPKQVKELRDYDAQGELSHNLVNSVLLPEEKITTKSYVKVKSDRIRRFFGTDTAREISQYIILLKGKLI